MTSTGFVTTLRSALVACPLLLAAPAAALAGQAAPAWAAYGQSGQAPAAPPAVSTAADAPLPLSLSEAIDRGLKANLGVLLGQARVRTAEGERWEALSELLPNVDGHISETRQRANLESFGFTADLLPGVPKIVGPFNVFDARITASQAIVDISGIDRLRARNRSLSASKYSAQDARDVVVLGITNLYLQAVSATSRIEAKQAETATSKALFDLATDMKQAGTVAGIDVLRAQVQWQADQQQLIVLRNDFAKQKLVLARAVGLDPTKPIELTDRITYQATPPMTVDAALSRALEQRADLKAANARLAAAQLEKRASSEERLPTFGITGNYGVIGLKATDSLMTFAIGAGVTVPIFEGGRVNGKIAKADATLRQRQAELDDLTRGVKYEVQAALLDLGAAAERVQVAQSSVTLAGEQETQAQDRFKAGVANSLELVQAQAAVAAANEAYIAAVYEHNLAKASLARSLGIADASIKQFVSGAIQ
jgi:outer membrane protein TolC